MRIIIAALPLLALTACGGARPATPMGVAVRWQTVTKEVMRPCPAARPPLPARLPAIIPTDAVQLAALLGAKLAEWSGPGGYGERADAALRTCTAP